MLTRLEIEQRTISRSRRKSTSLITLYYVLTVMTCNYSHLDKVSYRETGEVSCGHLFRYNFQSYNTNTLSKAEGDEKKENIDKGLSFDSALNSWRRNYEKCMVTLMRIGYWTSGLRGLTDRSDKCDRCLQLEAMLKAAR